MPTPSKEPLMPIKAAVLALLLAGCQASVICDRQCKVEGWESGYSETGKDQCVCQSSEYLYKIMKGSPRHVCKAAKETPNAD